MKLFFAAAQPAPEWRPAANVYRAPWGWLVRFDLAGVDTRDVFVELGSGSVSVEGSRRDCSVGEGCSYYSMEIAYTRFKRTIELPGDLTGAEYELQYHNGMLTIRIQTQGSK